MILYVKRSTFNKCSILVGAKETICIGSPQNYLKIILLKLKY